MCSSLMSQKLRRMSSVARFQNHVETHSVVDFCYYNLSHRKWAAYISRKPCSLLLFHHRFQLHQDIVPSRILRKKKRLSQEEAGREGMDKFDEMDGWKKRGESMFGFLYHPLEHDDTQCRRLPIDLHHLLFETRSSSPRVVVE
jgi:hypothetical protein